MQECQRYIYNVRLLTYKIWVMKLRHCPLLKNHYILCKFRGPKLVLHYQKDVLHPKSLCRGHYRLCGLRCSSCPSLDTTSNFGTQAILQIAYMGLGFSNWWVLLVHTGPSTTTKLDTLFLYWQKGNCSKMGFCLDSKTCQSQGNKCLKQCASCRQQLL
jgi:hypothetical protein